MIFTARRGAARRRTVNVDFVLNDATDLSCYPQRSFDTAVSTMAMHQFDPETGLRVLMEMRRIACRIIIADYSCPMRPGPAAWLARMIERAARGDHYRNFRQYMARGGLGRLAAEAGLQIVAREERGEGVFTVAVMMPAAAVNS
jgi:ubiquinone/menaquinone biosynthesis C-methylase UbiE